MANNSRINNSSDSFDSMALEVLEDLNDPQQNRFSSGYIKTLFDEGQREYCEDSGALRSRIGITSKENQRIYNFPDDMVRPIRLEDKRGKEIAPVTGSYVESLFGNNFRNREKNKDVCPMYYYSDYVGDGQFELYPNPSPTIEKPFVIPNNGYMRQLFINNRADENILSDSYQMLSTQKIGNVIYALSTHDLTASTDYLNVLNIYNENGNGSISLVDTITFTTTVLLSNNFTVKEDFVNTFNGAKIDAKYYFSSGVNIFEVDKLGVVSTILTHSTFILKIYPTDQAIGQTNILFQDLNNDVYSIIPGNAAVLLHSPPNSSIDFEFGEVDACGKIDTLYVSYGTDGVYEYIFTSIGVNFSKIIDDDVDFIVLLESVENVSNEVDKKFLYMYESGSDVFKRYSFLTLLIEEIDYGPTVKDIRSLHGNGVNEFWGLQADNLCTVFNLYKGNDFIGEFHSSSPINDVVSRSESIGDSLYHFHTFNGIVYQSTRSHGDIAFVDGHIFESEFGGLIDLSDDEDTVNFIGSEVGGVNVLSSDEEIVYLIYVRRPVSGLLEISSPLALKEYAKYRARLRDGDAKSISLAQTHLSLYNDQLRREMGRMSKGYNEDNTGTLGQYF